ncbi:MAG: crossover junction endodeoxyribonuclease RuvC [Pseudomonadota bacterium]
MGTVRILGIDPGLRRTGWGIIEASGSRLSFVACGLVKPDTDADLATRLAGIHHGLQEVMAFYAPAEAGVEETFVNTNARATLKLGQARGVAMLVPALSGVPVSEYAPNLVKKTVIGAGHGDKAQIRAMLGHLLPRARPDSEDEADALAIAICHAHHRTTHALVAATAPVRSTARAPRRTKPVAA